MTQVSISLSNIQNIKTVNIEGIGVFKVRRLGPGEEYDLSMKRRRLIKLAEEVAEIQKKMNSLTDEAAREDFAQSEMKKIDSLSDEVAKIQKNELEVYKRCFTDDANGEKTDHLIDMLTNDERMKLYSLIFASEENTDEE